MPSKELKSLVKLLNEDFSGVDVNKCDFDNKENFISQLCRHECNNKLGSSTTSAANNKLVSSSSPSCPGGAATPVSNSTTPTSNANSNASNNSTSNKKESSSHNNTFLANISNLIEPLPSISKQLTSLASIQSIKSAHHHYCCHHHHNKTSAQQQQQLHINSNHQAQLQLLHQHNNCQQNHQHLQLAPVQNQTAAQNKSAQHRHQHHRHHQLVHKHQQNDKHYSENKCENESPLWLIVMTFLSVFLALVFGWLRDTLRYIGIEKKQSAKDPNPKDFPPLYSEYESFYMRNLYIRLSDCFNRPVCSVPGPIISILERVSDDYNWTFRQTGRKIEALNMGSYNYLGFAENTGKCPEESMESIRLNSVATCSPRQELGNTKLQLELEEMLAQFLGVESSIVFGMGFATNATNIPNLVGKGCLIVSDELNHASLVLGSRLSGATVKVFKHNNMEDLEQILRESIIEGQLRTHRPWKKILIIVEGVYSMEGSIVRLPEIIALKKKYKAYLYLDEAHSIGAVGPHGRGVVDYWGCDPKDIDIMMGTFTKSFGSAGGYIAGTRKLVDYLHMSSHASCYASSMSPPVIAQIRRTLETIMGLDGSGEGLRRIKQLAENTRYFRDKLIKMGFIVYGNHASPVVPVMLYMPSKIAGFNRMMLEKGIACVTVGFPATGLTGARVRFCISAAHTREMLEMALEAICECGHMANIRYSQVNKHQMYEEVRRHEQQIEAKIAAAPVLSSSSLLDDEKSIN